MVQGGIGCPMRLALLALLLLLPSAAAEKLAPDGAAVAGAEARLVLFAPEHPNATSVLLRPCVGDGSAVRFCYPPRTMERVNAVTWELRQKLDGTSGGEQLGLNATVRSPQGNVTFPREGEYLWYAIDAPRQETPVGWAVAPWALAALLLRRRR